MGVRISSGKLGGKERREVLLTVHLLSALVPRPHVSGDSLLYSSA